MREKERNLDPKNIERIRKFRFEMSESEKILWEKLNDKKLGFKFRRQHPIGPYALDFYCPKLRLCLEVDGEQHNQTRVRDQKRDQFLRTKRILTVRIPSLDLWGENNMNTQVWVDLIRDTCEARATEISKA